MQDGSTPQMNSMGQTSMLWEKQRANIEKIEAYREMKLQ